MKKPTATGITEAQYKEALTAYENESRSKATLTAKWDAEITKVGNKYVPQIETLNASMEKNFETAKQYCEQNKETLFAKAQSIKLGQLKIGFRKGTFKLVMNEGLTIPNLITALKKKKLNKFVRSVEEVDKQALVASREDKALVNALPTLGISFKKEEKFFIEPVSA